jgi:hypothetical protein
MSETEKARWMDGWLGACMYVCMYVWIELVGLLVWKVTDGSDWPDGEY